MKRKTDNFNKFYNKKNNAAIKEAIRQEKKAAKKERKEAIERHFEEKRQARANQFEAAEELKKLPGKKKKKPTRSGYTIHCSTPYRMNCVPLFQPLSGPLIIYWTTMEKSMLITANN